MEYTLSPSIVAQVVAVGSTAWILWKILRPFIVPSSLNNIPGPAAVSWWKGNLGQLFDRHGWGFQDKLSQEYGGVVKLKGFLGNDCLYVTDPVALHSIIVKDQDIHEAARWALSGNNIIFGPGIFATHGHHHRKQRKLMNPVFSQGHMRGLVPIFYEVVHRLRKGITAEVRHGPKEVDVLKWMGRTALELIGKAGLGYSFDPLVEETNNAYGRALKQLLPAQFSLDAARMVIPYVEKLGSSNFRRHIAEIFPDRAIQHLRQIVDIMDVNSKAIFHEKKTALEKGDAAVSQQVDEGKDLLSLLLRANINVAEEDRLPEAELVAQLSSLVFAATDTTSNALSRILHLLALNQDVQQKLRAEISEARNGEDLTFDQLMNLPFLDAVCRESLRLFAPVTFVSRETRQDTVMPLSEPIHGKDGNLVHQIVVPKDTTIIVGIRGCNHSKAIWGEDVLEWKPERWLSSLPESVSNAKVPGVYANLMTFLGGDRSCIGFKFSQLEMKVALSVLLDSFKFSLSNKDIVWNLAGVSYPTVGAVSDEPSLPLKVEAIAGKMNEA